MKTIRLVHGTDALDLRDHPAFRDKADATDTLPDGREVPRFVWHARDANSATIDPALRGRAVQVTDAQALELLTYPGLRFEEATPEQVAADQWRATLTRDMFGRLVDPATGQLVDPAAPPAAPVIAVSTPRDPEEIKAEVARELAPPADLTPVETPAEAGGRKKPQA